MRNPDCPICRGTGFVNGPMGIIEVCDNCDTEETQDGRSKGEREDDAFWEEADRMRSEMDNR